RIYSIFRYRHWVGHVAAWLGYALVIYLINLINVNDMSLGRAVAITLLLAFVFYPVLGVLYHFFRERRYICGIFVLMSYLFVLLPSIYYFAVYVIFPVAGVRLHVETVMFDTGEFFKHYGLRVFRFSVYAYVFYAVDTIIDTEK